MAGSRFRGWRATSLPGVCMELVERVSAFIFWISLVRDHFSQKCMQLTILPCLSRRKVRSQKVQEMEVATGERCGRLPKGRSRSRACLSFEATDEQHTTTRHHNYTSPRPTHLRRISTSFWRIAAAIGALRRQDGTGGQCQADRRGAEAGQR